MNELVLGLSTTSRTNPENVRFYERFGFEVIGEEEVLGNSNWFMLRRPQKKG